MPDLATPFPESVAAVDLGSNSFHLIVARTTDGEPVVVDRLREMVQLASGLDENKKLDRAARDRALDCLRRFGQRVGHMPRECVRAVGTNTLRSAHNADEFLAEAEEALGHPIETISGIEEARLIYLGVTHTLAHPASRRLVLDIGGGSTELIVGESFQPIHMESLYLGCVSLSRKFFPGGEITEKGWRRAELAAMQELGPARARFTGIGWDEAVGASGTIRQTDTILRTVGWSKRGITAKGLRRLRDAMVHAGHVDRLDFPLDATRRPVFPGGVAVLAAAFETLGIERMQPADGALREGLLYDLLGRIREEDVRARTVTALGDRYHVDWKQAGRVECTALQLLDQTADPWQLGSRQARQLLSWSAQLHEIGLDIAHASYHKHGAYVIEQSDLFGFSREEQKLLAALVRAHRRKFPAQPFRTLPRRQGRPVERLAILLRLAVVLHRSRNPDPLPGLRLTASKKALKLDFPDGWLDTRPLTRADLEQEASYLRSAGYRLDF